MNKPAICQMTKTELREYYDYLCLTCDACEERGDYDNECFKQLDEVSALLKRP